MIQSHLVIFLFQDSDKEQTMYVPHSETNTCEETHVISFLVKKPLS